MQEQQEKEAIHQLKAGNIDGLEVLFQIHHKAVYRMAYGFTHHHYLAEEATQKVFISLPTAIMRYDPERPFLRWLYRIAARRAIDEVRRNRRRRETPIDCIPDCPAPGPSPDDKHDLWAAIESLDLKYGVVIVLRYYLGYSGAEIAEILGCPPGTVGSRLNTARRQLREFLDPPDSPITNRHPQPRPNGPSDHPRHGSLAESVWAVVKRVGRQIGAAGEQPVGREL